MTVSKFLSLPFLLCASLCLSAQATPPTTTTNTLPQTAAPRQSPRTRTAEDELARHLTAAQTYQLAGDLERAAVENRAIASIALSRLGAIAIREGEFTRAVALLDASLRARDDARARTNLSIAHMRLTAIDQAVAEAQAALKLDDKHAPAHHVLGKLLYMKGDYRRALPELERAILLEPDLDAAYTLGMTYLRLKETARAKLLFEEMQSALNNSAVAHILFGRAYQQTGYATEAEREFKQALAIDPRAPRAHFYLGYLIMLHGGSERLAQASEEFARELRLRPQDFYSHFFLGVLASSVENDHPKAIRHLSEAVRLSPAQGEAYLHLGQSQLEAGDTSAAERSLRRAIELTSDVTSNSYQIKKAHFLLGRVLIKSGRRAEGDRELAIARELQGQSLESSRQAISDILGQVAAPANIVAAPSQVAAAAAKAHRSDGGQKEGASSVAGSHVGSPVETDEEDDDVLLIEASALDAEEATKYKRVKAQLGEVLAQSYHNLGVIAAQQGQLAAGAESFAAAAEWKPDLAGLDRNRGIVSFRAAQYDKAIPPLSRQLKAHPDDALARRMLGVSFYLTGNFEQAVETLKPLEATITSDPELAYTYGVSLVHRADNQRAASVFARLSEQHAASPPARFYAAQGFMMIEDYERASKEFRTVAALDPRLPQAHYHAGQSLIRLNRLEEAGREFRQELLLNPSDASSKYHLAYVLLEQKRETTEALRLLREAIAARADYSDARYQLGKALVEQGNTAEAIEHLEHAARIDPSKDYIHYQLSIAYRRAARTADAERALQLYRELKASNRNRTRPSGSMGAKQNVP